ncbi:flagellin [Marinobacter sp. PJ-38]|nr:flagellin [Marinobacter panjinensis]
MGANSGDTIEVDLSKGSQTDQIGGLAQSGTRDVGDAALAEGDLTISVGESDPFEIPGTDGDTSAKAKAEAIDSANIPGLPTVSATNVQTLNFGEVTDGSSSGGTYSLNLNVGTTAVEVTIPVGSGGDSVTLDEVVTAVNDLGLDGFSASEGTTAGTIVFNDDEGRNIELVSESATGTLTAASTASIGFDTAVASTGVEGIGSTLTGQVSIEALDTIRIGGNNPQNAGFLDGEVIAVTGSLENIDVKTVEGSNDTIKRVDSALTTINSIRSELGAVQNRFESTIANLSTTSENLSAANSRIRDADFAAETAELARTQVLQQAGLSVLSQANARPQQVLQLLQG